MRLVRGHVEYQFRVPADMRAPAAARHGLNRLAERIPDEDVFEELRLLVNELVTNGVRHGARNGQWLGLNIVGDGGRIRVEVTDPGPGFEPVATDPGTESISGRGLFLVDAIADRWGVACDGETCVWFELDASMREAV